MEYIGVKRPTDPITFDPSTSNRTSKWGLNLHPFFGDVFFFQKKGDIFAPFDKSCLVGGGNSNSFFYFHSHLGKMDPIWRAYFSDGLVKNHQPVVCFGRFFNVFFFQKGPARNSHFFGSNSLGWGKTSKVFHFRRVDNYSQLRFTFLSPWGLNIDLEKLPSQKKLVFQPSFLRGYI